MKIVYSMRSEIKHFNILLVSPIDFSRIRNFCSVERDIYLSLNPVIHLEGNLSISPIKRKWIRSKLIKQNRSFHSLLMLKFGLGVIVIFLM
ncbi:hypothetical protein RhiirC2_136195 [Rhizophagus irregularis]|uniref:Uncharacterized protein n=1 Tax=Rhizophagus irregularis TaxID=588596 RepID=A0A2N1MPH4_9GLOM|nr:hypothetical protein RhiirC2_136195 [Rhizophagus irregularis]